MNLKDYISILKPKEKSILMIALENGFSQVINLSDDRFVGVNVCQNGDYEILETVGDWSLGVYKKVIV